ncbi:MAG: NAD(P)H-binding protein [Planctomycetota bacterium]
MTQYAVTAASGKLAAEVVKSLSAMIGPEKVVGLARTPGKANSLGVEIRPGDYEKPAELKSSLAGVEAVLLISGMDAPDKRVGQHRNVIEAAKAAGVQRIVYTSIQGLDEGTAFSSVVSSNRQTEQDVQESELQWSIGRNGIYIEPDIEYIDNYKRAGEIANCAGDGKCGYTTRPELGFAYAKMLAETTHHGRTYNLHGASLSQTELANFLSDAFKTRLRYRPMTVEAYREERIEELGEFLGTVISGIYEGIQKGGVDNESHFAAAAGREHRSWESFFGELSQRAI